MARIPVDFSKVKSFNPIPDGTYEVKCTKAEHTKAKSGNQNSMIKCIFEVQNGRYKGSLVVNNFVLLEKSLWTLMAYMQAAGLSISQGRMSVDTDKLVDKTVQITVATREFNGQRRNQITGFMPTTFEDGYDEDYDDPFEEDEDPKPSTKANRAKPTNQNDDDDDYEEDPPPKKPSAKKAKVVEEFEENEEDNEEPVSPKKRGRKPQDSKPAQKPVKKETVIKEDEEDGDLDFQFLDDDDEESDDE